MRISFLEVAGFRGVRHKITIPFSSGFMVICGRNGSGKSTFCDAIEFALTGDIHRFESKTEKGETVKDYFWWRGEGPTSDHYVSIGIVNENEQESNIKRGERSIYPSEEEIHKLLCNNLNAPAGAIGHLCRTAIIRDELISDLSLDLSETERFNFVRSNIGIYDLSLIERTIEKTIANIRNDLNNLERNYTELRTILSRKISELSDVKAQIPKRQETEDSEKELRHSLNLPIAAYSDLFAQAQAAIPKLRIEISTMTEMALDAEKLLKMEIDLSPGDISKQIEELMNQLEAANDELKASENALKTIEMAVSKESEAEPEIVALGTLYEIGKQIGLKDGRCALCGTGLPEHNYQSHLDEIRDTVDRYNIRTRELIQEKAVIKDKEKQANIKVKLIQQNISEHQINISWYENQRMTLINKANNYELPLPKDITEAIKMIAAEVELRRLRLFEIEKHLAVLESSNLVDQATELERSIEMSKKESIQIEGKIKRLELSITKADEARRVIKRVSGEMVEERLAALSPLLKEMYLRLQPHIEWQELDYQIRGDVRHFLSLRVGENLNPAFVFSSGQRRAAGLAFLVAVNLSRSWSCLRTLILDDPIQHIDDFRSLHLVEVLSAIRKSGYQVICTVEDPAMAELLCRRLQREEYGEGVRVDLKYTPVEGIGIERIRPIGPLPRQVLLSA